MRAAIMTGQYGPRTGVYTVGGIDRFDRLRRPLRPVDNVEKLPLDRILIPQLLKNSGYATGMFGKWHLGNDQSHHPARRGFDEAIVSAGKHFNFETVPTVDYPAGEYLADFLTERAVDFIRRHKDRPFFLYLSHFGVHAPHDAKKDLIERFANKPGVGGHNSPVYAAMITSVDQSVGRVMQTLDELQLADNTVLIFTSDNGGVGGYRREGLRHAEITDNAPLRSGKGSLYEGGTRVPLIVRWPNVIRRGAECTTPTIHVDFLPTFVEIAKAGRPDQPLDGESLVPLLGDPARGLRCDAIFQHFPGYLGAGPGALENHAGQLDPAGRLEAAQVLEDGHLELYYLRDDVGETKNLANQHPEITRELHDRLAGWRQVIDAPLPIKNDGTKILARQN